MLENMGATYFVLFFEVLILFWHAVLLLVDPFDLFSCGFMFSSIELYELFIINQIGRAHV